jgi:hypothetical protein
MYRRKLALGAAVVAGLAATQIAFADAPSAPRATAAQGGLAIDPARLVTTARRGASGSVTITNSTGRKLRMTVRARPWRQARNGDVAANRSKRLGGVSVNATRFTLTRVPSRKSQYGALDVVGKPTRRRKGINVNYNLISSLRFNPTAGARRYRLRAGRAKVTGRGSSRALVLQVRNRGNTVDEVGGSVDVSGSGGGKSGTISSKSILPGKRIDLRLMGLGGMRRGSYTASITLSQAGKNRISVTRSFRIR